MCIVAMGKFGGHEMGYASDADVLFVHDPLPGADEETATRAAQAVALRLRGMLAQPGPDPALRIDADLRPEGRQGPLVRTLASYRAYYRRWSLAWEAQALLRAEPVAGDLALGDGQHVGQREVPEEDRDAGKHGRRVQPEPQPLPPAYADRVVTLYDGEIVDDHTIEQSYLPGARDVDASNDPSIRSFLSGASGFFDATRVQTHRYVITRQY